VCTATFRLRVSFLFLALLLPAPLRADEAPPRVYVVLWFDTEDYILPASDDAALRVAEFLTGEGVRATFKVVGEKARTLERRKRGDVIAALKKHEIGYHANWHSVQPSPAMYLSPLGWDDGVAEFDRREGPGRADVERIFGQAPSCYGQPGSSWGPQSYGAMSKWGMKVYLDAGSHVNLDGKPCYYAGILNLYKLTHTLRADLNKPAELEKAKEAFAAAREALRKEGGGVVSIFYHPCEFVHKEFWDGVNFRKGANPPPAEWKEPLARTPEESRVCYQVFADYIRFIKRFADVRFITASEAANLYRDRARGRRFRPAEIKAIAAAVTADVTFQTQKDYALSASEVFALLNEYVAARVGGRTPEDVEVAATPLGPTGREPLLMVPATTDASQFGRTSLDLADSLRKEGRVPTAVWLGSTPVPPEAYLRALARVAADLLDGKEMPEKIEVKPAKLAAAERVAEDNPGLWGWVIFPPGFRAPGLMKLARQQAWTLKPALLDRSAERGEGQGAGAGVRNEELRQELLRRVKEDQEWRKKLVEIMKGKPVIDPEAPVVRKGREVDERNTARMKEIVERHGWPGKSLVGGEGAHAAWLLVQHADHDRPFQKRCLALLAEAVKKGDAAGGDLAYLTDRVRVGEGQKQVYGTQFSTVDGKLVPAPIEDEANVDRRRKEVGLQPLAEYLKTAEQFYNPKPPVSK
jgi:hypothetical protein